MAPVICIVGFRNPDDIVACLDALAASTWREFEVVVCENGGQSARDELAGLLGGQLPGGQQVEVLPYQGNSGYAGGNNRCIEARPGADAWWILNPDTRVAPEAMALLLARLDTGACDAVGGTLCHEDGRVQAYGGKWNPRLARASSIGHGTAYDANFAVTAGDLDYILGASLMFTRAFRDGAGPMRDDYFLYGEEVEWCLRAKARGLRLGIEPRAIVYHGQGTTTGDGGDFRRRPRLPIYLDQRNKLHILRDTGTRPVWPAALGSLAALAARAAKRGAWRQLWYGMDGWFAGVRNERGVPDWVTRGLK